MQLLDALRTQRLDSSIPGLLDVFSDILNNVQIQSNFYITHPEYKPLELPDEVVARFQQLPLKIQNTHLSLQLRTFLYRIYYNGSYQTTLAADQNSNGWAVDEDLENNTVRGLNLEFCQRLCESNRSQGYFDPGWLVLRQESDGSLAVEKKGLILHIRPDFHLQPIDKAATIGSLVAIRMPHNLVQNGFYVAVGNAGRVNPCHSDGDHQTVNVYFNLSPEGAVAVMKAITEGLNRVKIPFTFKVLYNPSDYGRYDSGVLCFEKGSYRTVKPMLKTVYAQHKSHFLQGVPLFTKQLLPGLALSEEPDYKFTPKEDFGMNRCQIVANALLEAWLQGHDSPEGRMNFILHNFSLLGIDIKRPYLNANSKDIY